MTLTKKEKESIRQKTADSSLEGLRGSARKAAREATQIAESIQGGFIPTGNKQEVRDQLDEVKKELDVASNKVNESLKKITPSLSAEIEADELRKIWELYFNSISS